MIAIINKNLVFKLTLFGKLKLVHNLTPTLSTDLIMYSEGQYLSKTFFQGIDTTMGDRT